MNIILNDLILFARARDSQDLRGRVHFLVKNLSQAHMYPLIEEMVLQVLVAVELEIFQTAQLLKDPLQELEYPIILILLQIKDLVQFPNLLQGQ